MQVNIHTYSSYYYKDISSFNENLFIRSSGGFLADMFGPSDGILDNCCCGGPNDCSDNSER